MPYSIKAMRIIDADSHFQEPIDWLKHANTKLHAQIPQMSELDLFIDMAFGDLLDLLPFGSRPDPLSLAPPRLREWMKQKDATLSADQAADVHGSASMIPRAAYLPDARIKWLDKRGIDVQLVLPTTAYFSYRAALKHGNQHLATQLLATYNRWAAEQLAGHTHRLVPVMLLELADIRWSIAEMQRMRALGSRAALVTAEPVQSRSLSHPCYEPFWAAAEDLGVAVMFHVGAGRPSLHPGWANNGGNSAELHQLVRITRRQLPESALGALVFGGVLERHPGLAIVCSELGIDWLPSFLERIDNIASDPAEVALIGQPYSLPMKPSQYIQRQVCVSVVPEYDRVQRLIDRVPPGIVVFASDFPHPEGNRDAVRLYREELRETSEETRSLFFSGSMARLLRL